MRPPDREATHPKDTLAYTQAMCGRVIQASGPVRYAIVDGLKVRDSRLSNYRGAGMALQAKNFLSFDRTQDGRTFP